MLLDHWSQHSNGWCQPKCFIGQWDLSSFACVSCSGSSSSTVGCMLISCSRVLVGARVSASGQVFTAAAVTAPLGVGDKGALAGDCVCGHAGGGVSVGAGHWWAQDCVCPLCTFMQVEVVLRDWQVCCSPCLSSFSGSVGAGTMCW